MNRLQTMARSCQSVLLFAAVLALPITAQEPEKPVGWPPADVDLGEPVPVVPDFEVYSGELTRRQSYLSFWDGKRAARVAIEHGQPAWKPKYDALVGNLPDGRYRLGSDDWTRLRTNVPFVLAGRRHPVGEYCLCLERRKKTWQLVMIPAAIVAKDNLVPFASAKTGKLGATLALKATKDDKLAKKLQVSLVSRKKRGAGQADLVVAWGKHRLLAEMVIDLGVAKPIRLPKK